MTKCKVRSNPVASPRRSAATEGKYGCITPAPQYKNKLDILYYNCRGLANEARVYEFEKAVEKLRWDIIGLAETRISGEKLVRKKNGNLFYFYGETKGYRGVGFFVKQKLTKDIIVIRGVSERICYLKLKVQKNVNLLIIQVKSVVPK